MLPQTQNYNCFEYLKICTENYGDYNMLQHFGIKYSRSKIFRDIDNLAAYFQKELKLKKGDIYTVFMPTTVQAIVAFYALNKIGVAVNFLHPLMSSTYLTDALRSLNSKGVMVLDVLAKKHVNAINGSGLPCLICCSSDYSEGIKRLAVKTGEKVVKTGSEKIRNATYYKKAVSSYHFPKVIENNGDDIAVYLNGGGTTGKSKTIKLTSKAINELAEKTSHIDRIYEIGEEALIAVLPLFHCFGLCLGMHTMLCFGARLIPMMRFNAKAFNKLMRKNKVVGIMGIPLMFRKLMQDKGFDGPHLKNVRLMFCGGDDVSDSFLDEFNSYFEKWEAEGRLRQGYGLTETSSVCCVNTNTDYKRGTIGKPLDGLTVEIWDESQNKLPDGEVGEIVVSGSTIMEGYYLPGEKTDYGLYTDGDGKKWVLTGDLGYKDNDGYFHFSGRKKRVIIIAGYNVYPGDIEKKLSGLLPFIKELCAVQGWQGERSIIRLYVSLKEKGDEDEYRQIIQETCRNNFSKYSVPKEIVFMEELPHTQMMKVDFMKLTEKKPE